MDQLKEILRHVITYRFWILVGIAALMPVIAYFASHGAIAEETTKGEAAAKSALDGAKKYENGVQPNAEWKALTDARTAVQSKNVNQTWRILYDRQAPLLDWPPEVEANMKAWGKEYPPPEVADDAAVARTINTYVQVYPAYVDKVYRSFRPFNFEDGTGVVVAPPKEALLQPAVYSVENPPTLGKVWAAQQRLWIQRTVLAVIDDVNQEAEDWDGAPIKQINLLAVASPLAQDQRSVAKAEELEIAPEIVKPGSEEASTAAAPAADDGGGRRSMDGGAGYEMAMRGMAMTGGMSMYGGTQTTATQDLYVFKSESDTQQFQVIPVAVSLLIDQNRMLDLLAAFEDSPMSIQVVDFEWKRPGTRVTKPEKGQDIQSFGGLGSSMLGMGEMVFGSSMMMPPGMGMGLGMGRGMGMGGEEMQAMMRMQGGRMMGMGGYASASTPKKAGTSILQEQLKKEQEREERAKAQGKEEPKKEESRSALNDPYYNIVEVSLYGQARFYNPPPPEEPESESAAEGTEAEPAEGAEPPEGTETTKPEGDAPAGETPEPSAPAEPDAAKAEPAPEGKSEAPASPDATATPEPDRAEPAAPTTPAPTPDAAPPATPDPASAP